EGAVEVVGGLPPSPDVVALDVGEDLEAPTGPLLRPGEGLAVGVGRGRVPLPAARREIAVGVVVGVKGEADLLEVVLAAEARGGLADLLHRGDQQGDQHREDGDHHQQLDQREGVTAGGYTAHRGWSMAGLLTGTGGDDGWKIKGAAGPLPRIYGP